MGFFFGRNKGRGIPKNATFRLTQLGEEKLGDGQSDIKGRVLLTLQVGGSQTIDEIASRGGMSRGSVEKAVFSLAQNQYVQPLSSSMGAEVD